MSLTLRTVRAPMLLLLLSTALGGCGVAADDQGLVSDPVTVGAPEVGPAIVPVLTTSELVTGPNRFLFTLVDRQNVPIADPEVLVDVSFYPVGGPPDQRTAKAPARFVWVEEGTRGLYVSTVTFPSHGRWGTSFETLVPDGSVAQALVEYDVLAESVTPAIGAQAPSFDTPTASDVDGDLALISSDPSPEPRFYEASIADALAAGDPFVVAFATPLFCRTGTCGPMLDVLKVVAASDPATTFIHVEPYLMQERDGSLQPVLDANGQLQVAPWTGAWSLITEPFVVAVDRDGIVRHKFEGALSVDELQAAIEDL